jgi:hypothetical protein
MPVNTNDLRDMASEFRGTSFTAMVIEAANQLDSTRTERNILRAELDAAREELDKEQVSHLKTRAKITRLRKAAQAYFTGYMQDEAADDGPEMTGCSLDQHDAAKRLAEALKEKP